ncbi:hypothetical protein F4820DRAFT_409695 [Hypoxylon rubiginosum]|uniref:Uncharacterized protein n=1 Tax=Hypoxylon rubiginosum TaxID=110542 RepID=A0ACB9ZBK0_9PEZI|nr:hypothetical protein F4820DRAFT_409695 [Hypoxylon rubiginosum]
MLMMLMMLLLLKLGSIETILLVAFYWSIGEGREERRYDDDADDDAAAVLLYSLFFLDRVTTECRTWGISIESFVLFLCVLSPNPADATGLFPFFLLRKRNKTSPPLSLKRKKKVGSSPRT